MIPFEGRIIRRFWWTWAISTEVMAVEGRRADLAEGTAGRRRTSRWI